MVKTIIGMSSPAPDWTTRLGQVGKEGITARRIFAKLNSDASDQLDLVKAAHDAGMMPVFSFKVPDVALAVRGDYDAWVQKLADKLAAFAKTTVVVFNHEPNPDMTGAQFVAVQKRYTPILQKAGLKTGPFLNGWLLDNKVDLFTSYTTPELLRAWDFMGIDTYESGTIEAPGAIKPADRLPKLLNWLKNQGLPDKPIGIGEYNGYSAKSITDAGEGYLSTPSVWFACMWNATTGKGYILDGARLDAFRKTKQDTRVAKTLADAIEQPPTPPTEDVAALKAEIARLTQELAESEANRRVLQAEVSDVVLQRDALQAGLKKALDVLTGLV